MLILDLHEIAWTKADVIYADNQLSRSSPFADYDPAWNQVHSRIAELRALRDGWDGEGGQAPSRELLDSVRDLLKSHQNTGQMPAPSRISATSDGTISIEWQMPPVYASLEVNEPYQADWLIEREGYPPEFRAIQWRQPSREDALSMDYLDSAYVS